MLWLIILWLTLELFIDGGYALMKHPAIQGHHELHKQNKLYYNTLNALLQLGHPSGAGVVLPCQVATWPSSCGEL